MATWTSLSRFFLPTVPVFAAGAGVRILPDYLRPDPFGGVVLADGGGDPPSLMEISGARGRYVSVHVTVSGDEINVQSILGAAGAAAGETEGLEAHVFQRHVARHLQGNA